MTTVVTPTPISETDALNYMLTAIGEAPVVSILTATQADTVQMIAVLKSVVGEIQRMKWRFNTEWGYTLQPNGQLVWTDVNGVTETLNVFEAPPMLADFEVNPGVLQQGALNLDLIVRRAIYFQDPPTSGVYPMVFYDRQLNREGVNAAAYPTIQIDPTWYMPFEDMPDVARLYCAAKAARMYVERGVNSGEISQFVKTDEAYAYRTLRRSYGIRDDYNALRTVRAFQNYGFRPAPNVGFVDNRGQQFLSVPTQPTLPALVITPSTPTASVAPNTLASQSWSVKNNATVGGPTGTYQATVLVDGVKVISSSIDPVGRFTIAPQATQTVVVNYTTGPNAGTGTAQLMVVNGTITEATSTLTVTVT